PHLTVRENVAFGLKQRKMDKETINTKVDKFLKLMQIFDYADRKPDKLSGGQQQRVALARALVIEPDVLLMDEPLSNLDAKLRVEMREAIREIQHKVGITTVYVTHDQEEAMAISDEIAVMKDGIIQHLGKPREIYHRPQNLFVASFIGRTNLLDGDLVHENGAARINLNCGYTFLYPKLNDEKDQKVRVSIRPEDFLTGELNGMKAKIVHSVYLGLNTEYYCVLDDGTEIQMVEESNLNDTFVDGQETILGVKIDKINVFTPDGSSNLCIR
ncbi:MAG TPA: ABC transporter ATP-binding protein, partial [Proteiniclasticum sp.]|nr:ABC transporter ATP-binding protein [Proteiniclasticum sp.]